MKTDGKHGVFNKLFLPKSVRKVPRVQNSKKKRMVPRVPSGKKNGCFFVKPFCGPAPTQRHVLHEHKNLFGRCLSLTDSNLNLNKNNFNQLWATEIAVLRDPSGARSGLEGVRDASVAKLLTRHARRERALEPVNTCQCDEHCKRWCAIHDHEHGRGESCWCVPDCRCRPHRGSWPGVPTAPLWFSIGAIQLKAPGNGGPSRRRNQNDVTHRHGASADTGQGTDQSVHFNLAETEQVEQSSLVAERLPHDDYFDADLTLPTHVKAQQEPQCHGYPTTSAHSHIPHFITSAGAPYTAVTGVVYSPIGAGTT